MKNLIVSLAVAIFISTFGMAAVSAQTEIAATASVPPSAEGLDLNAVAEVFKDSDNLEKFEENINNPAQGINNLDLDNDGSVDFIRATEQVNGDTHLIVLQVPLGENDFQDVATIAAERTGGENYNLQIQGDPVIYGADYYVVPADNNFRAWNVVRWIFRPNYRPYVPTATVHTLAGGRCAAPSV
jgi:hypothetical protein